MLTACFLSPPPLSKCFVIANESFLVSPVSRIESCFRCKYSLSLSLSLSLLFFSLPSLSVHYSGIDAFEIVQDVEKSPGSLRHDTSTLCF